MASVAQRIEDGRELLIRTVECETCGAQPGQRCVLWDRAGRIMGYRSHTGRYHAAATAGLVPAMAGAP